MQYVLSNARLKKRRWTHIAIVGQEQLIKLYVNGILDSVNGTTGLNVPTEEPLLFGGIPQEMNECGLQFMIDELSISNRALLDEEIEAQSAIALGGIEPSYLFLGCISCTVEEAFRSCIDGFHLCTTVELYSTGF